MNTKNKWDKLAKYFLGSNVSSADNVEIIEPVLISELEKINNLKIIDFGCGSGNFCKRISGFAESILGLDSSEKMISIAKAENSAKNIQYSTRSIYETDIQKVNVLNAEFVVQFLSDEELENLLAYLSNSNIQKILIANDRIEFINQSIANGNKKFSKDEGGYSIGLGDEKVRLFPRTVELLKDLFSRANFELENVHELKYPDSFLEKFPEIKEFPVTVEAYTICIYKRK